MGDQKKNVTSMENAYVRQEESKQKLRTNRKKKLFRRLVVFFLIAFTLTGFLISSLISRASVLEEKKAEKQKLEEKLVQLEKKEKVLKEEIVKLNDDDYIAKIARRDYFFSDEGEVIFNIPEKEKKKEEEESSY
ncbi:FtsB family cell division protein [Rossellomorea sp. BNER]|jgi:cell division protein DivIC|uniref:FtsB family cell division protein n=1 Tax=Rossellomorea sp. BNER TaxID=2962031 RepID=UPI003AF31426|nr:septum formation initiator family protein [Rossellomorea sp. BNER]